MQDLKTIQGTDYMSRSREVINNNFTSVASNFSGATFPSVNVVPYMICYRTDQGAFFMLNSDGTTWEKIIFIVDGKVYVPNASTAENAKKAEKDKNSKDITTYVASVSNSDNTITVQLGNGVTSSFTLQDTTYDAMVGASASRAGESGLVPSPKAGDDDAILFGDGTWKNLKQLILDMAHPVGSYYWSSNPTSPATLFGGTWTQVKDKFIYASGKYNVGATGGAETVTLTTAQIPAHTHTRGSMNITGEFGCDDRQTNVQSGAFYSERQYKANTTSEGGDSAWYKFNFDASRSWVGETSSVGSGQAHNNMPPYEVAYCWKRTA